MRRNVLLVARARPAQLARQIIWEETLMIGYMTLGVSDLERAKKFYCDLFADRNASVRIDAGRIAFIGCEGEKTMLAVCTPFDGEEYTVGNGVMVSFPCESQEEIAALYDKALSLGATCEGAPGQRIPGRFHGAYVRDLDGHKLCFYMFG